MSDNKEIANESVEPENVVNDGELTDADLDKVSGGAKSNPAFEIKDFSFGVENPTTIG